LRRTASGVPRGAVLTSNCQGEDPLYRAAIVGGAVHKLIDDVTHADWSPDGRRIVFL